MRWGIDSLAPVGADLVTGIVGTPAGGTGVGNAGGGHRDAAEAGPNPPARTCRRLDQLQSGHARQARSRRPQACLSRRPLQGGAHTQQGARAREGPPLGESELRNSGRRKSTSPRADQQAGPQSHKQRQASTARRPRQSARRPALKAHDSGPAARAAHGIPGCAVAAADHASRTQNISARRVENIVEPASRPPKPAPSTSTRFSMRRSIHDPRSLRTGGRAPLRTEESGSALVP